MERNKLCKHIAPQKIIGFIVAAVMLAACFGISGCELFKSELPEEPVASWSNVPEEYWDLFHDGSFDGNNIWATDDERFSAMIAELKSHSEEKGYGSTIIATDDKVIFAGGFNAVEVDGVTTVNPFTTYEIGSITKQFTAAAILQQVQAGKLSTEDTLDKFFPDYENGKKINIGHLLHMESGIEDYLNTQEFFKGASVEERQSFLNGQMSDEDILNYLYKTRQNMKPGTTRYYCNTNYWLLALILEQVSGQTYEEYIKEHIFDVCDMPESTCCEYGNITSVPKEAGYHSYGRCSRGAGDIHSNVCDMLRWDRALFGGKLVDEEQMEYIYTMPKGYSCGWMQGDGNDIGHSGQTDSYVSINIVMTSEEFGRVYLVQLCPYPSKAGEFLTKTQKIAYKYILGEE